MDVNLQYFRSCPGWQTAEMHLREALDATGRTDVVVRHELIETNATAEEAHFMGSPTVPISRRDP